MVRFRLTRMPFLQRARHQIVGGLWYKPGWWDATRKVPPGVFQPQPYRKKDVPNITYPEDSLIAEFERRNPALLEHDPVDQERPERHVASAFAAHQLKLMEEGGLSRDAAYDATRDWLIANGRKYLAYMHVDEDEWEELRMPSDPLHSMSPKKMYRELLLRQKQQLKASLAADLKKHAPKVGKWARLTPYRTWRSEEDLYMIQQRLLGGDVTQLARVDTESEGEAEDGADGSGAEYSGGAGAEFVAHSGDGGDGFALDETAGSGDLLDFDEAPADSDGSADGRAGR